MKADMRRMGLPECGIPLRAELPTGGFGAVDLAHLDAESIEQKLGKSGPHWVADVLLILLGRDHVAARDPKGSRDAPFNAPWMESRLWTFETTIARDELAQLPSAQIIRWAESDPEHATRLVCALLGHCDFPEGVAPKGFA